MLGRSESDGALGDNDLGSFSSTYNYDSSDRYWDRIGGPPSPVELYDFWGTRVQLTWTVQRTDLGY